MDITYYGHSVFGIDSGDVRLVIDPWIDDNPHCDATVDDFADISAVLVTHHGVDHFGEAPRIAKANDAELVCDFATGITLRRRGFPERLISDYVWGAPIEREGWYARVLPAFHHSFYPDEGISGPAQAYLIEIGGERFYHLGDTSIFGDLELFGELYDPTICCIPVGQAPGYYPELLPEEAALVTEWLDPDIAIPMHYLPDGDRHHRYERHCRERGLDKTTDVRVLDSGETISV